MNEENLLREAALILGYTLAIIEIMKEENVRMPYKINTELSRVENSILEFKKTMFDFYEAKNGPMMMNENRLVQTFDEPK